MYICICYGVTDSEINQAIDNGANSRIALGETLGAGTVCRRCVPQLKNLLQQKATARAQTGVQFYQPSSSSAAAAS